MTGNKKEILLSIKEVVPEVIIEIFGPNYNGKFKEMSKTYAQDISNDLELITAKSDTLDDIDKFIDISEKISFLIKNNSEHTVVGQGKIKKTQKHLQTAINNLIKTMGIKTKKAGKHLLYNKFIDELNKKATNQRDVIASQNKIGQMLKQCLNMIEDLSQSIIDNYSSIIPSIDSGEEFSIFLKLCFIVDEYIRKEISKDRGKQLEAKIVETLTNMVKGLVNNFGPENAVSHLGNIATQIPERYRNALYKLLPDEMSMQLKLLKTVDITEGFKDQSNSLNISGVIISQVDADNSGINTIINKAKNNSLRIGELIKMLQNLPEKEKQEVLNWLSPFDKNIIQMQNN